MRAYAANPLAAQRRCRRSRGELMARLAEAAERGPAHVVLFDDYDLSAGPTGGPLAPLLDLLAVGRDIGLHVVLTRRVGGSARGAYEAVFGAGARARLARRDPQRRPRRGPAARERQGRPQPPGRGLLVRRGERPLRVQTAFTPAGTRPPDHPPLEIE